MKLKNDMVIANDCKIVSSLKNEIKVLGISVVLIVVVSLRAYGQMIFPISNPGLANDLQQLAAFEEGCRRIAEATTTPQVQTTVSQFPGLSTADGSAQLFQATMQNYQMQAQMQMQSLQSLTQIGANLPESLDYMQKCTEACKRGKWNLAVRYSRKACECSSNSQEKVQNYTQLAILCWNNEDYGGADMAMREVIAACGQIAPDCDANARKFRTAIRNRSISGKFSVAEATTIIGVWDAVCSIPNAIVENNLRNWVVYADGEINKLRHDGAMMARAAKRKAAAEYTEKTGKEFYLDDPPMRGTPARVHWDAANRVYQIFE